MPEATVGAIITRSSPEGTRVLLTRRNHEPFDGLWCLPGGHIEPYEAVLDAVCREVREETGLDFAPRFVGFFDERIPEQDHHHVVLVFEGNSTGEVVLQASEVSEYGWFTLREARSLPLAFRHNDILDAYAKEERA